MRITRTLAATLAVSIAALAVPAAHAQRPDAAQAQADMHASVALAAAAAAQQQDLRNADAHTAAAGASSKPPTTLDADMQPAAPANPTDEDGGAANGLGALAGVIVIGLAYLYRRRAHRSQRLRAGA